MPSARFVLVADEAYFDEAFVRFRRQLRWRIWMWVATFFLALVVATVAAWSVFQGHAVTATCMILLAVFVVVSPWIDRWLVRRHVRKLPHCGDTLTITLSEQGLHSTAARAEGHLQWSCFTKARRFPDGLMLFQGPRIYHWLPDRSADPDGPQTAEELARAQLADFRVVGRGGNLIREKLAADRQARLAKLVGSWPDAPSVEEIRAGEVQDQPREVL